MAKLKAPLMSLGASGAIGKALVFFPWKGLDVVREYVIPSNPKTTLQLAQRAHLTAAVAAIHAAEADTTNPLGVVDKSAYALYGSTFPTPRTWFNQIAGRWLIAKVKSEIEQIFGNCAFSHPGSGNVTIMLHNYQVEAQTGYMYCGTSKTALTKRVAANGESSTHTGDFTGLSHGVKYFFQFRPDKELDDKYVMRSGIYHHVCP